MKTLTQSAERNQRLIPATQAALEAVRSAKWNLYQMPQPLHMELGGRTQVFRPGLTFTPFANPVACNAHCAFCSEELQRGPGHQLTARRLTGSNPQWFTGLASALHDLRDLRMGLSLSGLEATADPAWLLQVLDLLVAFPDAFDEKVLYTNGSGLLTHPELADALLALGWDRIELSRMHWDAQVNQQIMRFNRNQPVHTAEGYTALLRALTQRLHVKNSCILNQAGVHTAAQAETYVRHAADAGVQEIVFRELSRLDETWMQNRTAQWVAQHRTPLEPLLQTIAPALDSLRPGWEYLYSTVGYYYYNEHYRYAGAEVIFETSSYPALMAANATGIVQKLVYHSGGNLCGDWDPDSCIVARYGAA